MEISGLWGVGGEEERREKGDSREKGGERRQIKERRETVHKALSFLCVRLQEEGGHLQAWKWTRSHWQLISDHHPQEM